MASKLLLSPAVRYHLTKHAVDPSRVSGTGPKGRILKGDVLEFLSGRLAIPTSGLFHRPARPLGKYVLNVSAAKSSAKPTIHISKPAFTDTPNSGMRKTIARRLTESKMTVPHAYMSVECPIDRILQLRSTLKAAGRKVSVNDFIIEAVASALVRVPEANVRWENEQAMPVGSVDVGVAVATDSGLIVPVVFGAQRLDVFQISETVKHLAAKARDRTLQPHEFQGGSISVSNLGMFGITSFTAIINPPQASILAVGSSQLRPMEEGNPLTVVPLNFCFDARAIAEEHAAAFLTALRRNLETPAVPPSSDFFQ